MTNNDNDNMEYSLTPAEHYIYEWAKDRHDEPFCFLDFEDKYAHGTVRNAFSKLKGHGLIKLYCRSTAAYYVHSSSTLKASSKPVTVTHTVDRRGVRRVKLDLGAFLDSLDWEDVCRVHNVVFSFSVDGLYGYSLKVDVDRLTKVSKDIRLSSFRWSRGRILKVVLHRNGKVTSYLKCSDCPVKVSLEGLASLACFLGGVRIRLVDYAISTNPRFEEKKIPEVNDWMIVQWHYGRDGAQEISGPAFNVTFRTWFGELARIYMRHSGQLFRPRLEVVERPGKTLPESFAEKIDPNFHR